MLIYGLLIFGGVSYVLFKRASMAAEGSRREEVEEKPD